MPIPDETARRLFIGLMPDSRVQARLQEHCRGWDWPRGSRLTRPQRLHLTLHFLGDTLLPREQALREALHGVPMEPLNLVLAMPQAWSACIAVLRPRRHDGLLALRERIGRALEQVGVKPTNHWTPHVTLARHAAQAKPPEALLPIPWTVCAFSLVWSRLTFPVRYEVLERYGSFGGSA